MQVRHFAQISASFVALVAACGGASGPPGGAAGGQAGAAANQEPAALAGITAAHNQARAGVVPAADPPMPPLAWSAEVASAAQGHASKCVFEHSGGPYGENLFATTGVATPANVVASWIAEAESYDHATNSCSDVCGHYTQVVWADSLHLGCGMADCTTGSPFDASGQGSWQLWVCNYDPPGNWVGQSPY
jgi:pathogenesis-related protein 1